MANDIYLDVIKIIAAFVLGAILGIEREYRSKPAGFRTLIMITVGAALFSTLSLRYGGPANPDRIASNIITGIGFIGAGVIFKEGLKVNGMTTASTIWIAASIGMAIGFGAFYLAGIVTLLVLLTLMLLSKVEDSLDKFHQVRVYKISFRIGEYSIGELEDNFFKLGVKYKKSNEIKEHNQLTLFYTIGANHVRYHSLNEYLRGTQHILSFEV